MRKEQYDVTVIGGGPAGMAAALELGKAGGRVALIDREPELGGILMQCVHNGFGLHRFKADLTGPEYAERFISDIQRTSNIAVYPSATVTDLHPERQIIALSPQFGLLDIESDAIVLAMGCRERNRGNLAIPGTRPSGIFTAGFAQKLVNLHGILPGQTAVIVGSGDIGLIMARRLMWSGVEVKAVIEIMPYPGGLVRNIVQCLHDFQIPLHLSHTVTQIVGQDRVSGVEVARLNESGQALEESKFMIPCDTILLSVGLIPENELSLQAGITLNAITGGPLVDSDLMTSTEGIFACGNVLHVHDLADWVSEEAERCARGVLRYIERGPDYPGKRTRVVSGNNVRYVVPNHINPQHATVLSLRPLIVGRDVTVTVRADGGVIKQKKQRQVQPSEMIQVNLNAAEIMGDRGLPAQLEIALECGE